MDCIWFDIFFCMRTTEFMNFDHLTLKKMYQYRRLPHYVGSAGGY